MNLPQIQTIDDGDGGLSISSFGWYKAYEEGGEKTDKKKWRLNFNDDGDEMVYTRQAIINNATIRWCRKDYLEDAQFNSYDTLGFVSGTYYPGEVFGSVPESEIVEIKTAEGNFDGSSPSKITNGLKERLIHIGTVFRFSKMVLFPDGSIKVVPYKKIRKKRAE